MQANAGTITNYPYVFDCTRDVWFLKFKLTCELGQCRDDIHRNGFSRGRYPPIDF